MSGFWLTEEQEAIRDGVAKLCAGFDDEYWRRTDETGQFPEEFVAAIAAGGWLGVAMPESVGGAGLGLTEATIMMQAVAESGAGFSGASAIHLNIFGPMPIVKFGTDEQRARHLPRLISGEDKMCFAVTEPNSGLDTSSLETRAEKVDGGYRLNGRKIWTTSAQRANKILIIARTTPKDQCAKPTQGLSLFYTDREKIEAKPIPKMGRKAVECNMLFIEDLFVPQEDLVGEEGKGFAYLLHGLNPERVLFAAEAVGLGRVALSKAVTYAKERVVFGRPIGQNQGIQHPLAKAWAELEAANLMAFKAAALYDMGKDCGAEANAAKYLGAEAGFSACETSVLAHGGMGYAKEYDVERYFREAMIARIAPVSREMILNFIAERVLGLPKSY
ncbi:MULTISPECIES: acyl-CoA dehydrogenase family protein [unclassified Caulobacter]|uniref:acyl-CoA dehydrogenase family protein n=1 Tax=unclassified Caulobacter TaxID=2648921 RepID=UPI000D393CDE|nr:MULTISPECIES: acyl-CoA dehydrogenase family protein [unclassified Caulobacter]PTS90478.1 acyl-CoA dehydrogenase [Caulobacter sp. HMWF009]PTT08199.1 acyl-CoA dehydrogenase [Caulobacter sp. HMWF025]